MQVTQTICSIGDLMLAQRSISLYSSVKPFSCMSVARHLEFLSEVRGAGDISLCVFAPDGLSRMTYGCAFSS